MTSKLAAQKLLKRETTHEDAWEWPVVKVDFEDGLRIHVQDGSFPQKGNPIPEAMNAIGVLKKILIEPIKLFSWHFYPSLFLILLFPKKFLIKSLEYFNALSQVTIDAYRPPKEYLGPFTREFQLFVSFCLEEMGVEAPLANRVGQNIALIFDYDAVYRWRLQDVFSETTPSKLFTLRELKRLGIMVRERDEERMGAQSQKVLNLLRIAILHPRIRKALQKAINKVDFTKLQLDEGDRYWCCFQGSYKFFGLTNKERMQMIEDKGWKIPFARPATHGKL